MNNKYSEQFSDCGTKCVTDIHHLLTHPHLFIIFEFEMVYLVLSSLQSKYQRKDQQFKNNKSNIKTAQLTTFLAEN